MNIKKLSNLDPKRAIYYSHLAQTYKKMAPGKRGRPGGRKGKSAAKQPVKKKIVQIFTTLNSHDTLRAGKSAVYADSRLSVYYSNSAHASLFLTIFI